MYTMQALWTQAREGLNVTSVILSNRAYAILFREYANVSAAQPTKNAHDLMELRRPEIDWVSLAKAHGVPAEKVTDPFNHFWNCPIRCNPGGGTVNRGGVDAGRCT